MNHVDTVALNEFIALLQNGGSAASIVLLLLLYRLIVKLHRIECMIQMILMAYQAQLKWSREHDTPPES